MKIKILDKTITFDGGALWMSVAFVLVAATLVWLLGVFVVSLWMMLGWWLPIGTAVVVTIAAFIYPGVKEFYDEWE